MPDKPTTTAKKSAAKMSKEWKKVAEDKYGVCVAHPTTGGRTWITQDEYKALK